MFFKIFLGISFVSHGYFPAEKFLELAPSRSLGSPKLTPSTILKNYYSRLLEYFAICLFVKGGGLYFLITKNTGCCIGAEKISAENFSAREFHIKKDPKSVTQRVYLKKTLDFGD